MELNIGIAISIWRTDDGYRTINSFLTKSTSTKDYIYHRKNNKIIEYEDPNNHTTTTYNTIDVINVIKQHMKKSDNSEPEIYYRGGSKRTNKDSTIKTSFISVSSDEEQAKQFVDDGGCLYKVIVDPSVKRYKTGIEYETLLENGLNWDYKGKQGKYHVVHINKPQEHHLNIETTTTTTTEHKKHEPIEDKTDNLTEDELQIWLDIYKEESLLFDIEPTPTGFISYIEHANKQLYENNKNLIPKLANKMLSTKIGGKKRNQMMTKRNKRNKRTKRNLKKSKSTKRKY